MNATPYLPSPPTETATAVGEIPLEPRAWTELQSTHAAAVDALTCDHLARTAEQRTHPVEDFLFTYYSFRPSQLRRWHPGAGMALIDAHEHAGWRFYRTAGIGDRATRVTTMVDTATFWQDRESTVSFIARLVANTQSKTAQFGCFGLHEWAMVYRAEDRRHIGYPLRLGSAGTDEVVEQNPIRCSHFDAYRFFTPAAKPRNLLLPDLDGRDRMEQPGCLHAAMDLYKWAYRLLPVVSSNTVLECFRLARDVRAVDMRASPYDLRVLGYPPIPIETPAGRSDYVREQRGFAERSQQLRGRLLTEIARAFPGRFPVGG